VYNWTLWAVRVWPKAWMLCTTGLRCGYVYCFHGIGHCSLWSQWFAYLGLFLYSVFDVDKISLLVWLGIFRCMHKNDWIKYIIRKRELRSYKFWILSYCGTT